ncbi:MAG TPA: pantetheine-phosphate adenylyltransferase [Planctomycetota bacterium]|nr:pantetheine-phosphate adenylyltransferase [Planctomycetota bacterium]
MVRALYPGSFDPVTFGHLDLVERALRLFDSVTVAAAENIAKQPVFTLAERLELLRAVLPARVQVVTFRGLVVDYCRAHGFDVIVRGLRTMSDFEYEYQMALTNRHLNPAVETVFVMPNLQFSYVSSSLIKDVVRNGGDVSTYLPPPVEKALRAKLSS